MKLEIQKRDGIALLFIVMSALSAVFLVISSLNYLQLFPGLSELRLSISEIGYHTSPGTGLLVKSSLDNPSSYSGFQVESISIAVYFSDPSNSTLLMEENPLQFDQYFGTPLATGGNTGFSLDIPLVQDQLAQFSSFYANYSGHVIANARLTATVKDFLKPILGDAVFVDLASMQVSTIS